MSTKVRILDIISITAGRHGAYFNCWILINNTKLILSYEQVDYLVCSEISG